MTPEQIFLVQSSFAVLRPQVDALADSFYRHLFAADSTLRGLFPSDMDRQREQLTAALGMAVRALSRPQQTIVLALQALGRRHASCDVRDAHHATVGRALLDALAEHLGDAFDERIEAAWAAAFKRIAAVMQDATRAAAA